MVNNLMNANPDRFAVLYYHVGESGDGAPLNTTFGSQRSSFYPGTSIPALWFDGRTLSQSSGAFAGILATRLADPTDVTIDLEARLQTANSHEVTAEVCIEGGGDGKTMRIYMAQAVDYYDNPDLSYYHRDTTRQGQAVQDVTLAPGGCTQVSHTFTFAADSMAQEDNIVVVAWAQDPASTGAADVHQAAQLKWSILDIDFSFDPERPAAGETVQFTDETVVDGPVVQSYAWDFDDGDTSALQNPTNGFPTVGCYDVSLDIVSDVIDRQVIKGVPVGLTEPVAAFSLLPTDPDVGEAVDFTDMSSGDFDGWNWDFGDGNTSTQQNPTHTYATQGDYDVTLTLTNGCDTVVATTAVTVCETVAPISDFYRTPTGSVHPYQGIFFYEDASDGVVSWDWDFDDGGTSTAPNIYHAFAAVGAYDVSLTVSSGCLDDIYVETINVCVDPTPAFSFWPDKPARTEPVYFTDETAGVAVAWEWDFGDGGTSTLQNPTHTYAATGSYTVSLTVTETLGCSGEGSGLVRVFPIKIFNDGFDEGNSSAWSTTFP